MLFSCGLSGFDILLVLEMHWMKLAHFRLHEQIMQAAGLFVIWKTTVKNYNFVCESASALYSEKLRK